MSTIVVNRRACKAFYLDTNKPPSVFTIARPLSPIKALAHQDLQNARLRDWGRFVGALGPAIALPLLFNVVLVAIGAFGLLSFAGYAEIASTPISLLISAGMVANLLVATLFFFKRRRTKRFGPSLGLLLIAVLCYTGIAFFSFFGVLGMLVESGNAKTGHVLVKGVELLAVRDPIAMRALGTALLLSVAPIATGFFGQILLVFKARFDEVTRQRNEMQRRLVDIDRRAIEAWGANLRITVLSVAGTPGTPTPGTSSTARTMDEFVQCSIFAPATVKVGASFLVQTFLHPIAAQTEVRNTALDFDEQTSQRGFATLQCQLPIGTRVDVHIDGNGLTLSDTHNAFIWTGSVEACSFSARAPTGTGDAKLFPTARLSVGGIPVGKVVFCVVVSDGEGDSTLGPTGMDAQIYRSAFCSYSSENIAAVLRCAQTLSAVHIDCFVDKMRLVPGHPFEEALLLEIEKRDAFLLFWSNAARQSKWVEKEAMHAARVRTPPANLPDIIPIILEGPPPPPPPEYLANLHFDDQYQYIISAVAKPALS